MSSYMLSIGIPYKISYKDFLYGGNPGVIWSVLHIEKFAVREGHIIIRSFIPEMNQFHIAVYNNLRTV